MPVSRQRLRVCTALVGLCTLLPACSSGSQPNDDGDALARLSDEYDRVSESSGSVVAAIVGSYGSSEVGLLARLASSADECLARNGFQTVVRIPTPQQVAQSETPILRHLDLKMAETVGYGLTNAPPSAANGPQSMLDPAYEASLSDSERDALHRVWSRCLELAQGEIFSDFQEWEAKRTELEQLLNDFRTDIFSSRPVTELMGKWSTCMDRAGYDVAALDDAVTMAVNEISRSRTPAAAAAAEQLIATADAECRAEVDLEARYDHLYRVAEAAFAEEHLELILQVRELKYGQIVGDQAINN